MAATQAQLDAVFAGVYTTDGNPLDNAAALDAAMTASVGDSVDQASILAIAAALDETLVVGDDTEIEGNLAVVDIAASGDVTAASVDASGNIDAATFSVAGDSGADATVLVDGVGTMVFKKGVMTTFTAA